MSSPESSVGVESAFSWKTYSVSRTDKAPLLAFMLEALEARGCQIVDSSKPNRAPFYIVFDTPSGERQAVLAYAFFANSKVTNGRPEDEHRFQIKYGSELKGVLELAADPRFLVTTLLLGIDLERGVFIAADPALNNPSPMSRSVEFKAEHVNEILRDGWTAWERERRPGKTTDRQKAELFDTRTEVLIGGCKNRLLDLIQLERLARGLDPGERHLVADKLADAPAAHASPEAHRLISELELSPEALFDLIDGAGRLKMAVRGWVAELKLVDQLRCVDGVTDCRRIEGEGQPDVELRWRGGPLILVECKNVLRKRDAKGRPKIDFQRTRASLGDPCSRYYRPDDFPVLAACLHSVTESWDFRFALTRELTPHPKCPGRIANNIAVSEPLFTDRPDLVFSKCSGAT